MKKIVFLSAVVLALTLVFASSSAAGDTPDFVVFNLSTAHSCPPNPPPGSTVSGGLLVNGSCLLDHVNASGGVLVTSTGKLELENNSSVSGGITVQSGGELDAGHVMNSGTATFTPNMISGGIKYTNGYDLDLNGATVTGKVTIDGTDNAPSICQSTFGSDLVVQNVTEPYGFTIGDPTDLPAFGGYSCPGNTIQGSLYVTNDTTPVEVEGNSVGGSVYLTNVNTLEFAGNTVKGSAKCSGDIYVTDGSLDGPNNVHGGSTCPA